MDPATAKRTGRETENQLVAWLQAEGFEAERRRQNGRYDRGDISVHGQPLIIEVKRGGGKTWQWGPWLGQTLTEMKNDGVETGLLAIRPKRGTDCARWVGALVGVQLGWEQDDFVVDLPPTNLTWTHVHLLVDANPFVVFQRSVRPGRNKKEEVVLIGSWPTIWELGHGA